MSLTVDSAISAYYANLANQATYYNFYSGVSLGLLAFLGTADELQDSAKWVVIGGYTVFALVNGYMIHDIQKNLISISDDIAAIDSSCRSFARTLTTMRAKSTRQVICFLIVANLAFLLAMC